MNSSWYLYGFISGSISACGYLLNPLMGIMLTILLLQIVLLFDLKFAKRIKHDE